MLLILKLTSGKSTNNSSVPSFPIAVIKTWTATWFYSLLLLLRGDVELNPEPKSNSSSTFSICQWHLNCISAHNYVKVFLVNAYIEIYKFDILFISETHFDSGTASDDNNSEIFGYNLVCSDHPSNNKGGGVWVYYKSFLPLRVLDVQYLQEIICFELKIGDKTQSFISLYWSWSQSQDDFEAFTKALN